MECKSASLISSPCCWTSDGNAVKSVEMKDPVLQTITRTVTTPSSWCVTLILDQCYYINNYMIIILLDAKANANQRNVCLFSPSPDETHLPPDRTAPDAAMMQSGAPHGRHTEFGETLFWPDVNLRRAVGSVPASPINVV